jgi:hypothetical protein
VLHCPACGLSHVRGPLAPPPIPVSPDADYWARELDRHATRAVVLSSRVLELEAELERTRLDREGLERVRTELVKLLTSWTGSDVHPDKIAGCRDAAAELAALMAREGL